MLNKIESDHLPENPVVLLSCPFPGTMPWAFVYLSAYLKHHGENVIVLNRSTVTKNDDIADDILKLKPLLVGIGSLYSDLKDVKEIIDILNRKKREFPIVIGGQMVTPTPRFALEVTGADIGVIGEGEITLLKLTQALRAGVSLASVNGIIYKTEQGFDQTGPGEIVEDLSMLPEPDFSIYPEDWWLNIGRFFSGSREVVWRYSDRVVYVHASRGCPYRCNFCYLHSKVRFRDFDDMLQHACKLIEKYDANLISILDELVLSTPKRTKEFVNAFKKNINRPVEYITVSRFDIIDRMDDELLKELKETGCRSIGFGFESGSQRMLDIMNKRISVEQIGRGVQRLTKFGIIPTGSFQVGQYTETEDDVMMTVELIKKVLNINPNIVLGFAITTPFPGSQLHEQLIKDNVINSELSFYEKYFEGCDKGYSLTSTGLKLVANGSKMSDQRIIELSKVMVKIYIREKKRHLGVTISLIEEFKRSISRLNRLICRLIFKVHPYLYSSDKGFMVKTYRACFDKVILLLERVSLSLRGLR